MGQRYAGRHQGKGIQGSGNPAVEHQPGAAPDGKNTHQTVGSPAQFSKRPHADTLRATLRFRRTQVCDGFFLAGAGSPTR